MSLTDLATRAVVTKQIRGVVVGTTNGEHHDIAAAGQATATSPMSNDTIFWIASMSKPITAVASMQLVERGVLDLDEPAAKWDDYLGRVQVLDGFSDDGQPLLRPARAVITLRNLLNHTSGFAYSFNSADMQRYHGVVEDANMMAGRRRAFEMPLVADPGTTWIYGLGIDWAGRLVEAASGQRLNDFVQENICRPLGMVDTTYVRTSEQRARTACVAARADGSFIDLPVAIEEDPEFVVAGAGMYSTAEDYLRFIDMHLGGGTLRGTQILQESTVDLMLSNHIADLDAPGWVSMEPGLTVDVSLSAEAKSTWSLIGARNEGPHSAGRAAGALSWAGIANTHFWVDRARTRGGVFLSQLFPFFDPSVMESYRELEEYAYQQV